MLDNRDYVLVMDRSGSMTETDMPGGKSRWDAARESTEAYARELSKIDPDGITLYTFNSQFRKFENTTADKVKQVYQEGGPGGSTVLAPVLADVFKSYLSRKAAGKTQPNGEILVVVTDGAPQDETDVAREIVAFTKKLENGDGEYGIQFIQVGKDQAAARFLKKLDDDLTAQGAKFDIVDTKTMDEIDANMSFSDVLLASLND